MTGGRVERSLSAVRARNLACGVAVATIGLRAAVAIAAEPAPAPAPVSPSAPASPQAPTSPAAAPPPAYDTLVTAPAPLHGTRLPRDRVPANVQTIDGDALAESHSLDLAAYLGESAGSVHVNQVQESPLQPDVQYRGFLASPVLGTPQGVSVFLNGQRLNEPFADTVNWDLIPANALRSVNLIPGSNPLFGQNTLGGALSLETKTGFSDPGAEAHVSGGAFSRREAGFQVGAHGETLAIFAAGRVFAEDGWRQASPSRAIGGFLSASYFGRPLFVDLALSVADTDAIGNGPAPEQFLAIDRSAVFTSPDHVRNRALLAILRAERALGASSRLSASGFYRLSRLATTNGDQRTWTPCMATGQVTSLCAAQGDGTEVVVTDRAGAPVTFDPTFDAANNTSRALQNQVGATIQVAVDRPVATRENHFIAGVAADVADVAFTSQATVARFDGARAAVDTGLVDPTSSVAVDTVVKSVGVYASDTLALRRDLFLTLSGRFNASSLSLRDQLGDALSGEHTFSRLNPAAGLSYQPLPALGGYASFGTSTRTPTPIELTCASPTDPCRLPNGFAADPPLAQVVARTFEVGARGHWRGAGSTLDYAAAAFRTTNSNDILFISSGAVANEGYFANVGETRRQGLEASVRGRRTLGAPGARVDWAATYTYLRATFDTPFTELSAAHPSAVGGVLDVPAGARLPSIPAHVAKVTVRWTSAFGVSLGATAIASSGQYLRGDEANRLAPLGGYTIVNVVAACRITDVVSVHARVDNLMDARYATFGVLGNPAEGLGPAYDSPRFQSPGAPRAAWAGLDARW